MTQTTRRRSRVLNDVDDDEDDEDHEDDDVTMSMVLWAGSVEQRQLDVTATATCREWGWLHPNSCFCRFIPHKKEFLPCKSHDRKKTGSRFGGPAVSWMQTPTWRCHLEGRLGTSVGKSQVDEEVQVDIDINRRETWTGMDVNKHERTL